jgi:hypothetical protein
MLVQQDQPGGEDRPKASGGRQAPLDAHGQRDEAWQLQLVRWAKLEMHGLGDQFSVAYIGFRQKVRRLESQTP